MQTLRRISTHYLVTAATWMVAGLGMLLALTAATARAQTKSDQSKEVRFSPSHVWQAGLQQENSLKNVDKLSGKTAAPILLFTSAEQPGGVTQTQHSELLPLLKLQTPDEVSLTPQSDDCVTLVATGASLVPVLRMIAEHHHLNLVVAPDVQGPVTISIRDATLNEVLNAIVGIAGFHWHQDGNLLYVTGSGKGLAPRVQGRIVNVYPLDYVTAADVQTVIQGLLSPLGSVVINEAESADQQKTRELLVIEDTAEAHERIAEVIARLNQPPRQVLIEAHVLQIALSEDEKHGVNLKSLARLGSGRLTLDGLGFAEDTGPGLVVTLDGTDMSGLLECIRQHTDSRTLASPKVAVVNHQEAKIQIGRRLPYTVATTTQTTTVQSVEFLEVGIVLTVQPVITADEHVLMTVLPKVSGGIITQAGYPEEETTEVSTTVMMPDGGGVVIGGLIREETVHTHNVVPVLHRVPVLGRLFTRKKDEVRRNELVVALVTNVIRGPGQCPPRLREQDDLYEALPPHASEALRACEAGSSPAFYTVEPNDSTSIHHDSTLPDMIEDPNGLAPAFTEDYSIVH